MRQLKGSSTELSIFSHAGYPHPPHNITESESFTEHRANTTLQWSSRDNHDTSFIATFDPPLITSKVVITSDKSLQLMVPYNVNYTVSLVATNCAGNSSAVLYALYYGESNNSGYCFLNVCIGWL